MNRWDRWDLGMLLGISVAGAVLVGSLALATSCERAKHDAWSRKAAADCHWRGYRTATVRCHGTGTPFDQDGGVRDRCVLVTDGYRMDGMTVQAGKWSLPRAACSVEWAR